MSQNLKCFFVANENKIIYLHKFLKSNEFEEESQLLLIRLKGRNVQANERDKINASHGSWFVNIDQKHFIYAVLCDEEYPERHGFAFLKELQEELSSNLSNYDQEENEQMISKILKKYSVLIQKKYEDINSLDQVRKAQQNVEDIQLIMQDNIQKMVERHDDLEGLESKAIDLKSGAQQFKAQSTSLARLMYWRNMKVKIIIAIVIIAILLYIIVPIIIAKSR